MTTAEKLLSRLCERKKSIIEQVKQRTASYSQHLASKLLIDGINPPPWLQDPSASTSKELNEDGLISKLLRHYPQSSTPWSVARYPGHKNSVITVDDENFLDGDFVENSARIEDHDQKNDPAAPGICGEDDHGECLLDMVPEVDAAAAASLEDRTDERILNIYTAPDQSLARIQRSKSRQKALQLRSSAKASAKSGSRHESSSDVVSSQIRLSPSITNQPGQNNELSTLGEPCIIGSQSCENTKVDDAHCLSREMVVDAHSERIIRSETYAEVPISAVGSIPLGCSFTSSQDARVRRKESMPIPGTEHTDNHVNKSPNSAGTSAVSCQSFRDRGEENATFICKDEEENVYTGEITRSEVSSRRQSCCCDSTKADKSSEDYTEYISAQDARVRRKESMPIFDMEHADIHVNKSPKSAGPSAVSCHSFRDRGEENATSLSIDEDKNVYTGGEITRSEVSSRRKGCGCDSTKADKSSDDYQGINIAVMDSGDDLPPDCVDGSLMKINVSYVRQEGCDARESVLEDSGSYKECCEYVDATMSEDKQCSWNSCNLESNADNLSSEILNLSCTLHKEVHQSFKWEDALHMQHSVLPSSNEDPQLTDVDQYIPVFERFTVNAQTDDGLDFAAGGFDHCELELPRTMLERASMLAELCRSASLDRPSSHFSSALKFQKTSNLSKSLSDDGPLDLMEFGINYPLNADLGRHFQSPSSSSDDYTAALDGMPYSVSRAYSGEGYGWSSRNQPPSPVGKLWRQLSSHAGSSGKCSFSISELNCFPIEEDPSSSEENKTMEENAGGTLDEIDSLLGNHYDKSQPLKDVTNMGTIPSMSVSAEVRTFKADSVDFVSSKFSVTGTQEKTFLGPKYQCSKKNETSEKQTLCTRAAERRKHQISSVGSNAIKRAKGSVRDSVSKLSVSYKTNLKGKDQKLSLRESRTNNIVSDVRSFTPLIQQKQAATTGCTGKRDVKVKALEAAEVAKHLMEKKANERNQRKEALKFERAEKNLKHMEMEKKKREEEHKKKNADIAKKRLREDEGKKEKKKKRQRLEPRQQQREQEEMRRVEQHEKENQQTMNDQLNSKKEFNNESKRQLNEETTREEGTALQKTDTDLTLNEECGTAGLNCDGEEMHAVDKSPRNDDLIIKNNQGKSYDISPYHSDDEDEEDDELSIKKYIPSWASKTSVTLYVTLQQELDPDVIFPHDRFCSIDEVHPNSWTI